ncbi:hypothetical protein IAD21_00648 [Abditibacteriota bacterium]|nr:hypothetical protein IAD21_00648 [Abditibacteriota bacterium]
MSHCSISQLTSLPLRRSLVLSLVRRLSAPLLMLLALCSPLLLTAPSAWAALPAGSRAYSWGHNNRGELGNNSTTKSSVPIRVDSSGVLKGKTITQIAVGGYHSLALCSDGTLAAWGDNVFGQLGNNSRTDSPVPVPVLVDSSGVLSGKTVAQIAAGFSHSMALCSDGTLVAWGYDGNSQLGTGRGATSPVPVLVDQSEDLRGKTVTQIVAGGLHSLALCSDGTLLAWGDNNYGQLGNNSTFNAYVPARVDSSGVLSGKTITQIAAGYSHTLALCSDGTLVAWGLNGQVQLGNNSRTNSSVPVLVDTSGVLRGKTVTQIAAGGLHSMALCSDGTLAAWGYNSYGELGTGDLFTSPVPVLVDSSGVLSGKTITQIAAGYFHSMALCSDGTLIAWGDNDDGQLGNNSTAQSWVPVLVDSSGVSQLMRGSMSRHTLVLAAPANTPPVVNSVTIAPANPKTNGTLTTTVEASDADGNNLTYSYVWRKNDAVIPGETGPSLDLSKPTNGNDGDIIDVIVTAHDGTSDSEPQAANSVQISNIAPQVLSVNPYDSSDRVGAKRTFMVRMRDINSASDIREMWLLINTTLDWSGGATLIYRPSASSPSEGQLFLRSGDNFLPPIQIGKGARSTAVLDNGAVRVAATDVSVTADNDGETLTLSITATIRDGLVGQNTVFARVQDSDGAVDLTSFSDEFGFIFSGFYTVTPQFAGNTNTPPTLSKLTPGITTTTLNAQGIAPSTQTFGFFAKDEDGLGDIESVWFLANKTRGSKNSATFVYYPRTRRLVLRSDDDSSILGGGRIGQPGIIENSQVRVDLSNVKLTIVDGKSFGLTLPLQAKTGLLGKNGVWLRVQDSTGITSLDGDDLGFVRKGNWDIKKVEGTGADPKPSGAAS